MENVNYLSGGHELGLGIGRLPRDPLIVKPEASLPDGAPQVFRRLLQQLPRISGLGGRVISVSVGCGV